MGLRINQNIAAMNAYRNLSITDNQMSKSLEKLSSGFRINRAADDAAGLSISEGLRSQVGGLQQAVRNAQDGVNVVQTADGALTETHSILQRMRDLAVQASNSGSQDVNARQAAQTEFDQLNQELDRIGNTTSFGGQKLLDGSFGNQAITTKSTGFGSTVDYSTTNGTVGISLNGATAENLTLTGTYTADSTGAAALQKDLQTAIDGNTNLQGKVTAHVAYDANTSQVYTSFTLNSTKTGDSIDVTDDTTTPLGLTPASGTDYTVSKSDTGVFQVGANNTDQDRIQVSIGAVNSSTLGTAGQNLVTGASDAIDAIDNAIKSVSTTRANLGAYQNRFEHTINNLNVAVQNLSASESQIRDTDMASEMTQFTRAQILSQAGTAMLAQANQASQGVLRLLQ